MPNTDSHEVTPRRGARPKKMSLKAMEAVEALKVNEVLTSSSSRNVKANYLSFSDEEEPSTVLDSISSTIATASGGDIFTFQGKKKHSRVLNETPDKRISNVNNLVSKTPHALRQKLKKGIINVIDNDSSDEDPYCASGSEYTASDSDSDSDTSLNEDDDENEDVDEDEKPVKQNSNNKNILKAKMHKISVTTQKKNEQKYVFKSDDYFSNQLQKKNQTSNNTLDKLKTPKLSQDQLQVMLKSMTITNEHEKCMTSLIKNYQNYFHKWLYLLHEGFNIIVYGLGSKRNILQKFHSECLSDLPVIIVNGFFPSLTLKDILDAIIVDLLELRETSANVFEACELIAKKFEAFPDNHLYLIIHNIEGDMLRNHKAQTVLSKLAAVKNIHLIASIDHINAPLIWDHNKLSKFTFSWWDVTTFLPYMDETSFESSMMVQKSSNLALSSLKNVFLSLTTNSKGIYLIMVKYQLENQANQYYQGMLFKDLYWACREAFLVSSDLALRAQLTEFVDHKMVKFKRSLDGAEYLVIPIQNGLLKQFLEEQEK